VLVESICHSLTASFLLDAFDEYPLIAARKNENLVKCLFGLGADPDSPGALQKAAANGCLGTVRLLLDLGADANAKDEKGETALQAAISHGHTDVFEELLMREAGA
jgi:ankyrin repeat protein